MVGCLENLFYKDKVMKLSALGMFEYSLGDDFLELKSRKHWYEKSSNSKLLKPRNLLILTVVMALLDLSMTWSDSGV